MGGGKQSKKICTITPQELYMSSIKRLPKKLHIRKEEKEEKKKTTKTEGKNLLHLLYNWVIESWVTHPRL